jgi:SPP1 gp7 family putative phage head morphogenesis protein
VIRFDVEPGECADPFAHHVFKGRAMKPVRHERQVVKLQRAKMFAALKRFFRSEAKKAAATLRAGLGVDVHKADNSEDGSPSPALVEVVLASMIFADWAVTLPKIVQPFIVGIAVDGGSETLDALGIMDNTVIAAMRTRAKAWGAERAAEMVGRKWVGGVLVDNPNARWVITDSTRDLIRDAVMSGLNEGASPAELASAIEDSAAFSETRALMVARTEMASADVAGAMSAYRATPGVVGKRWITAGDDRVSDECAECEAAGTVGLDENFPTGVDAPPNHPNCRCAVVPVFDDDPHDALTN